MPAEGIKSAAHDDSVVVVQPPPDLAGRDHIDDQPLLLQAVRDHLGQPLGASACRTVRH
jgi:hypothetical protein